MFAFIVVGVAIASGLVAAWSLVRMLKHHSQEHKAGSNRPPPHQSSAQAARVPETRKTMGWHLKGELWSVVFKLSSGVFVITAIMIWALLTP